MAELDPIGAIIGILFDDGSSDYVLKVLSLAGIPAHFELSVQEQYSHTTRKRAYRSRLVAILAKFSEAQRRRVAENIARDIATNEGVRSRLNEALS